MSKLRVLIVDDEPLARLRLRTLIAAEPDLVLVGEAMDGLEAVSALRGDVDVVFLDVQMPELDGFQVLDSLASVDLPRVVFVTAFNEHAVRAFEVNALDYLVKPFENQRFQQMLQKLRAMQDEGSRHQRMLTARAALHRYATRLAVRHDGGYEIISVDDIDCIGAKRNYVLLHIGVEKRVLRTTMNEIEHRLDPRQFIRIHRGVIVNLDSVRSIRPHNTTRFKVVLKDGSEHTSSRTYRPRVAALLRAGREP
jgi:two-component system, LytTR family, response regulator